MNVKTSNKDDLIKYIKENGYRFVIAVLADMSNIIYKNVGDITDVGIMGFAFKRGDKGIICLQWLNDPTGNRNQYLSIEKNYADVMLHHTIRKAMDTDADRLSRLLGGDNGDS